MKSFLNLTFFVKSPFEKLALGIVVFIILISILGDFIVPYDPTQIDFRGKLQPPSLEHPLGQDGAGRDVLSRVLSGARLTVLSTFTVIFVVLVIGCTIGIFSAFARGWVDIILM